MMLKPLKCIDLIVHRYSTKAAKQLKVVDKVQIIAKHKSIITYNKLRDRVLAELHNQDELNGVKWQRFPDLNELLKGHRKGELTVLTGPTGCGKSTFLSEYSLDLCIQGVCTLWGSFELNNVRLAKMQLTQFSQIPIEQNLDKFDRVSEAFERLPLYYLTFHGQQSRIKVLEAMEFAVRNMGVQHIIIDNIQFMIGYQPRFDRFDLQDLAVESFRNFSTQHNCHITLVIHPKKEPSELNTNSIFGGAKASQEADNVLIMQRIFPEKHKFKMWLDVTKNRFDGSTGRMQLNFNKQLLSYASNNNLKET